MTVYRTTRKAPVYVAAPPAGFDRATLGPRQIAGWVVPFEQTHEQQSAGGLRYIETFRADAFDLDLRDHDYPLVYEHTFGADANTIKMVPIGTVELQRYAYGLWGIAELHRGLFPDAVLEAARSALLGYSVRADDLAPDLVKNEHEVPSITRQRMLIREISVTAEPAYNGTAVLTNEDATERMIRENREVYYRQQATNKKERDEKIARIMLEDARDCLTRARELAIRRGDQVDTQQMQVENDLINWSTTMQQEAEQLLTELGIDVTVTNDDSSHSTADWEGIYGGQVTRSYDVGRCPL